MLRASSCRLGHTVQKNFRGMSYVLVKDTVCTVDREMYVFCSGTKSG